MICDFMHTFDKWLKRPRSLGSAERVENGAKISQNAFAFTRSGSKLRENVTLTGANWKRFLNGARWKGKPLAVFFALLFRCFWLCFSAQPPFSQNRTTLTAFCVIFFCRPWKVWSLSELLQTCQQILTASCEHMRTVCRYFLVPASCGRRGPQIFGDQVHT